MSEPGILTINTDGGARGNPGPAAFAYVIQRAGAPPIEGAGCLGRMTNNQAEYTALVRALEHAARLGTEHRLVIHSDSELLVRQMNGEYRVKDEGLRPLYEQARKLCARFPEVVIGHVPRSANSWADRLYNEALDGARTGGTRSPSSARGASSSPGEEIIHAEATACLRAAAAAWARGNPEMPPPEQVWDQLWSILEENGIIRRARR
jgi:ribonuclease HI